MKTSLLMTVLPVILSLLSCSKGFINPSKSRTELERYPHDREIKDKEDQAPKPGPTIFYTTVDFDNAYDWQRDTAYGTAPFTIRLHSGDKVILELHSASHAGLVGPSPETHHIINGHLFTERQDVCGTVILKDGSTAMTFPEREFLKGLIEHNGSIFTLTQECFGDACLLRENGETVAKFKGARVFGSFTDPTYPQTGALYTCNGEVCFCYTAKNRYYIVRDAASEEIKAGTHEYIDMKATGTGYATLQTSRNGYTIEKGGIYESGRNLDFFGTFKDSNGLSVSGMMRGSNTVRMYNGEAVVYPSSLDGHAIAIAGLTGRIMVWSQDGKMIQDEGGRFLSPSCAAVYKDNYALAIAPIKDGKTVLITKNGRKELDINGYISCINLTPPTR